MLYVDTSAILLHYLQQPDADRATSILRSDPSWTTARHTSVEVRRNLARDLRGKDLEAARAQFAYDWAATTVIELTREVCEAAIEIAETTGLRSLDALHLGAAKVAGVGQFPFATFDLRQAQAARSLGWTVLGS